MTDQERHETTERPHGVSCPGCFAEHRCNHCGAETRPVTGRCTSGRCYHCHVLRCQHDVHRRTA